MKILIIKHGAFGDMVNAMGAFSALRHAFPHAHITLLTNPAYESLARKTGFFNAVWLDERSKNPFKIVRLLYRLRKEAFTWVFDLQNSTRTSWYFRFLKTGSQLKWSGIAPGCSHPQQLTDRRRLHAFVRFADQLKMAGVPLQGRDELFPDMTWLQEETLGFSLPERFILLVPGSSKKGAYKRWTAKGYGELAQWISTQNITPVLVGGEDEAEVIAHILSVSPQSLDLKGKTSLTELGTLQKRALATVGNDTGAMHLSASVGCPTLVLWSKASSPEVCAPRGNHVRVLFKAEISSLETEVVIDALQQLLKEHPREG